MVILFKQKLQVFILKRVLKLFLLIAVLVMQYSVFAGTSVDDVKQNIIRQAKEMGVEPAIVLSIAKIESGFNQNAKSAGGHIGVFQLSHSTAKHMGLNPYNLDDNIKGGITYYKNMYNKFGSTELAVAAYNLGPEAIKRHHNKVPKHTQRFVSTVMKDYNYYKSTGL